MRSRRVQVVYALSPLTDAGKRVALPLAKMNRSIRILLADNHALVRQGLRGLLEKQGYQAVTEAADGQEALRLAAKTSFDVAILDVTMPILNGIDAARELHKSFPKTKTVLVTRHDEDPYITEALRAGVRGYVLKDQMVDDLILAIQKVLSGGIIPQPRYLSGDC